MISIIGIGNAASAIARKFADLPQYEVYTMNSKVEKNSKTEFKLEAHNTPEEYEKNAPQVKKFLKNLQDQVQVFVVGSSLSSIYTLGILEQIKEYYSILNETVYSCVHYLNYFAHTEPHIGNVSKPNNINKIRAMSLLDMKRLEEKWLFDLDTKRELCYYMCINEKRLESETGLHKRLVDILKTKPRNAYRKISYAIYETGLPDFGFCVAHTNAIQQQKTLDKFDQE